MPITREDHAAIAAAIHAAEQRTSGQIVCVLTHASSDYSTIVLIWSALLALFSPWPLIYFTQWSVQRIFLVQLAVFIVVALVCWWQPLRMAMVPRALRRARAHRAAIEQFEIRGLARKHDRSGILIFVSLAERYARIIADEGISARVPQTQWQAAVDVLVTHMRKGRIAEGFVEAIDLCGNELAKHFPLTGARRRELSDRIYLI